MTEPRAETGGPRTPRSEIAPVVPQARKEQTGIAPVLLWDTSAATEQPSLPGNQTPREVMTGTARLLTDHLGELPVVFFADFARPARLTPAHFGTEISGIAWGGGTHIMGAWDKALDEYDTESGEMPERDRPVHLVLIAIGSELDDGDDFRAQALKTAGPHRYFIPVIFGDGEAHAAALSQWTKFAADQQRNDPHQKSYIRVVSLGSVTDPAEIAQDIITMIS